MLNCGPEVLNRHSGQFFLDKPWSAEITSFLSLLYYLQVMLRSRRHVLSDVGGDARGFRASAACVFHYVC